MKVEMNKKESNVVELKVESPQEQVEQAIEQAYNKTRKDYSLPGFRKGRVPRNILEKRFGVEIFYEEAANILLQQSYPLAIQEHDLQPVDQPEVEIEQIDSQQPFIYTATVTVRPELKLGQYKGFNVERKQDEQATDEDVDNELNNLRNSKGSLVALDEDAVAAKGDQVIIDFVGRLDGTEFEGGTATNHPLILGSNSFVPGFEDQLVGAKVGDQVIVKVTMPEEYHSEELAGKDVEFTVDIQEVKRQELPELDDDFARDVGDYTTLDELKQSIRERLDESKQQQADADFRQLVLEKVMDDAEVDIPAAMVDNEVEAMVKQMENRFAQQGLKLEDYLSYSNKQLDDLHLEMRPEAEKNVKTELLLDAIVKEENITVEQDELDKEVAQLAEAYGQEAEKIREILTASGQIPGIEQVILHRKAIDFLAKENTPVE